MTESTTIHVSLASKSYDIAIGADEQSELGSNASSWMATRFESAARTALVVADQNVVDPHANRAISSLQSAGWRTETVILPPGEGTKCLATISNLYDKLVAMGADRQTVVVAVGGGVTGDAAGFAAASYARGIPFIQVPTSLLAHVDSSVGGKTGVNHPQGKNLIGAFHQPIGVHIDTTTLNTLPDRDFYSGMAEVVKYGVILDADFFGYLEDNVAGILQRDSTVMQYIIARCCRLKADVVENDEFERTGLRAVLNYGHTFAHAFEKLASYGTLMHGEAVSIGMVCASRLGERLGRIDATVTDRQVDLLRKLHLPVAIPDDLQNRSEEILTTMRLDKKTVGGNLRFILPSKMGHVETVRDVPLDDVRHVV